MFISLPRPRPASVPPVGLHLSVLASMVAAFLLFGCSEADGFGPPASAPNIDLRIQQTVNPTAADPGATVTFTVTVRNLGPIAAAGVLAGDTLPTGLTYASHTASVGSYTPATGLWTIGNLGIDQDAVLTLAATINAGTEGSTLTNRAGTISTAMNDTMTANNVAEASVTVNGGTPSPGPGLMTFGNLPAGMPVRTEALWTQGAMPAGWNVLNRAATAVIETDATSPTGHSLQFRYPTGFPDAIEAGVAFWSSPTIANHQEMFLGVVQRYSSNWVQHQNQVKLHLWNLGSLGWFGIFDGCWRDRPGWFTMAVWGPNPIAWPQKQGDCWTNNIVPVAPVLAAGAWVKIELYARKSTTGQSDGIIRMWINGALTLNATNLSFPAGFQWGEFQHAGTWGGGGGPVPNAQSWHIARTLIATQ
jgi:uncharacterized repeat protein (TIGR01451 family)